MNRYIELVAARHGVSPEEVRAEIQKAIDLAWNDPFRRSVIQHITGKLTKPAPDDLILALATITILQS